MKVKILKTCYHVYKEKLSTEHDIVEELKDNHLLIETFRKGSVQKINKYKNNMGYKTLFYKAIGEGFAEVTNGNF